MVATVAEPPAVGSIITIKGIRCRVVEAHADHRRWNGDWSTSARQQWNSDYTRSILAVWIDPSVGPSGKLTLRHAIDASIPDRRLNCDTASEITYEGATVMWQWDTREVYMGQAQYPYILDRDGDVVEVLDNPVYQDQTGWFPPCWRDQMCDPRESPQVMLLAIYAGDATADLMTTEAAARALSTRLGRSMSARRVQQLVRRGDFPGATRPARDWMIPRASVEAWQPRPSGSPGHFDRPR